METFEALILIQETIFKILMAIVFTKSKVGGN